MSNRNRSSFQMFSFVLAFKGTKNIILFFQLWAWVSTIVVFIGLFCFCFMPFSYSGVSLGVKHFQALKISYYDSNTLFLHISHIHFWSRVLLFHLPFQNMTPFTVKCYFPSPLEPFWLTIMSLAEGFNTS